MSTNFEDSETSLLHGRHVNDSRSSIKISAAGLKYAEKRDVVEHETPASALEAKDWEENGHLEPKPVSLLNGRVKLSRKAIARLAQMRPKTEAEPVSLRDALHTEHGSALSPEMEAWRVRNWHALNRYVFQDGIANPWQAFKNFLAVVRRTNPEYVESVSATTMGMLLGETRAACSAREIRIFEEQMKQWGVLGFHGLGGTKPESARLKFKQAARGNDNRKRGTELKRNKERAA